jgi:hypothetical protein
MSDVAEPEAAPPQVNQQATVGGHIVTIYTAKPQVYLYLVAQIGLSDVNVKGYISARRVR